MKYLGKYFLQGLLYVTPISVTVYALVWAFRYLDAAFQFQYPGLGILLMLVGVTAVGFLGSFVIRLPFFGFIDSQLERAPLIKLIYTSVKDLLKAFVGQKKSFNKPVLVKLYENSDIRRLGFVTDQGMELLEEDTHLITVYVPHSFAISGQLYLVPATYILPVSAKSTDVLKYIIAGGVAKIDDHE
jgi:uncharacterized membrane protein